MTNVTGRANRGDDFEPDPYEALGVRTIINARGATTEVGGTLMSPQVTKAMGEAAKRFVVLSELNQRVGEKIAEVTGAEAGYVTAGSAAGLTLAAAACIAGSDPSSIRRLPDTDGMANEIVIHRTHRLRYDQMFRAAGAKLVEIGVPQMTEAWELEAAITDRTAAVAYHDSPAIGPNALDFETVVRIARAREAPVIVDAASTLPPVDHLRRWIRWGADLVIYSGGKGIRGPQDSGILAGRADLIAAAAANGAPNVGIGRGMKVSKESMIGLAAALEIFLNQDHEQEFEVHRQQAEVIQQELSSRSEVHVEIIADPERFPSPIVVLRAPNQCWNPITVRDALKDGTPAVHANVELGGLAIHTHCLVPRDAETIAARLNEVFDSTE